MIGMCNHVRVEYLFRVSEGGFGTPSIYAEPREGGQGLPTLTFQLKPGTTLRDAEMYAAILTDLVEKAHFTFLVEAPLWERLREWWRLTNVRSVRYALARVAAKRSTRLAEWLAGGK